MTNPFRIHVGIRRALRYVGLSLAAALLVVGAAKHQALSAFYDYLFNEGPYLGSHIAKRQQVIEPGSALFEAVVRSPDYRDRRGRLPDFSLPPENQITAPATPAQGIAWRRFNDEYRRLLDKYSGMSPRPDALANEIMHLAHRYNHANAGSKARIEDDVFRGERNRAEDFVFYLVNAETACGFVGESMVALLRFAGFSTRLVGLAHSPDQIAFHHVFVEYFSEERRRWVYLDTQIRFNPIERRWDDALSIFEIMNVEKYRRSLSETWLQAQGVTHFLPGHSAFFTLEGPISRRLLYSPSGDVRARLNASLN